MISAIHGSSNYANTTQLWMGLDNEETYNDNIKKSFEQMLELGWVDTKIEYKMNSRGFRAIEFNNLPGKYFLTLGCSHTYGIGINYNDTWTNVLANQLNIAGLNLGTPGAAMLTCYRTLKNYLSILNPEFVVLQGPSINRVELIGPHHDQFVVIVPNYTPGSWGEYYKMWQATDANAFALESVTLDAMSYLCNQKNIPFYYIDNDTSLHYLFKCGKYGRDLAHAGATGNAEFAEYVYHKIINQEIYS